MSKIIKGSVVRVKPEIIDRLVVEMAKKLNGRVGVVESVFTPMGSLTERARVQWQKRGNRGKTFIEFHASRDLEIIHLEGDK